MCVLAHLLMYLPDAQNRTQGSYRVNITTVKVDRAFSLRPFVSQLKVMGYRPMQVDKFQHFALG